MVYLPALLASIHDLVVKLPSLLAVIHDLVVKLPALIAAVHDLAAGVARQRGLHRFETVSTVRRLKSNSSYLNMSQNNMTK